MPPASLNVIVSDLGARIWNTFQGSVPVWFSGSKTKINIHLVRQIATTSTFPQLIYTIPQNNPPNHICSYTRLQYERLHSLPISKQSYLPNNPLPCIFQITHSPTEFPLDCTNSSIYFALARIHNFVHAFEVCIFNPRSHSPQVFKQLPFHQQHMMRIFTRDAWLAQLDTHTQSYRVTTSSNKRDTTPCRGRGYKSSHP